MRHISRVVNDLKHNFNPRPPRQLMTVSMLEIKWKHSTSETFKLPEKKHNTDVSDSS